MSALPGERLLEVRGLSVAVPSANGYRPLLRGIDLHVAAGECVAIVGESGAGKTQLARALLGLAPPGARCEGRIVFRGAELSLADPGTWAGLRGAGIGLMFQDSQAALAPHRTLGRQLEDVLRAHGAASRAQARLLARRWFDRVCLDDADRRLGQYPSELSGGQRQRAALALALAARPAVLIADEPTSALDPTLAVELLAMLGQLRSDEAIGLVLISHDLAAVAGLADRVLTLYAGTVVEEAPVDQLYATPRHPYSACLLGRVAAVGATSEPAALATGCVYRGRCAFATSECATPPAARAIAQTTVRCHHPFGAPP